MKLFYNFKATVILSLSFLSFSITNATVTWVGGSNNDWNQVANWSPMIVPNSNDDVVIPTLWNGEISIEGAHASCKSIFYDGMGFSLVINSGWELMVSGDVSISGHSMIYGMGGIEIIGMNDCHLIYSDSTSILVDHINIKSTANTILENDLLMPLGSINIFSGTFYTSGRNLSINSLVVENSNLNRGLHIENSTVNVEIFNLNLQQNGSFVSDNSIVNVSLLLYTDTDALFNIVNAASKTTVITNADNINLSIVELNVQGDINIVGGSGHLSQSYNIGALNILHAPSLVKLSTEPIVSSYNFHTINTPNGCTGEVLFTDKSEAEYNQVVVNVGGTAHLSKAAFANIRVNTGTILVDDGSNLGNSAGILFIQSLPINYYWINGEGDWNDGNHWSYSPGGVPAGCIPTSKDNALFNGQSGFGFGDSVFIFDHTFCNDLIADPSIMIKPIICNFGPQIFTLNIAGSIDARGFSGFEIIYPVYLWNKTSASINMGGNKLHSDLFMVNKGIWSLQSNLNCLYGLKGIYQYLGTLNTNGFEVFTSCIISAGSKVIGSNRGLILGNSKIHIGESSIVSGSVYVYSNNLNLNAGSSTFIYEYHPNINYQFTIDGNESLSFYNLIYLNKIAEPQIYFNGMSSFNKITLHGNGKILNGGLLLNGPMPSIDTLVITGNFRYEFEQGKMINISKKVIQLHGICNEMSVISSTNLSNPAFVNSTANQPLDFENVWLENMVAVGSNVPFVVANGIDGGNNIDFSFSSISLPNIFYWNGESNTSHWSDFNNWNMNVLPHIGNNNDLFLYNTDHCKPGFNDSVVFHSNGFPIVDTLTIDENANFNGMAWVAGGGLNRFINGSDQYRLNNFGALLFDNSLSILFSGRLILRSSKSRALTLNNVNYPGIVHFNNLGKYFLTDDLLCTGYMIKFSAGSFYTQNHDIHANHLQIDHTEAPMYHNNTVNLGNSNISLSGSFYCELYENISNLSASNVHIHFTGFTSEMLIKGNLSNVDFGSLYFSAIDGIASINSAYYTGNIPPHFQHANFEPNGYLIGNNSIDTLVLAEGKEYLLGSNQTQLINDLLYSKGSPCYRTTISSTIPGTRAFVENPGCHLVVEHARLRDVEGTIGGCPSNNYLVGVGGEDLGNNVNWFFVPGDPINGLGLDTTITCNSIPYKQTALGFGRYASISWSTGSTADYSWIDTVTNISATVVYSPKCIVTDERDIKFKNNMQQNAVVSDISCNGLGNGNIQLHITDIDSNYQQFWIFPNSSLVDNDSIIDNLFAGAYTSITTITGFERVCSDTAKFIIHEPPAIYLHLDTMIPGKCFEDDGIINISSNGGVGDHAYNWNNDLTTQDNLSAMSGTNRVIVMDQSGCTDTLVVEMTCVDHINVPELLSPNGDGYSDNWEIIDLYRLYPSNEVKIFNRWGNLVYSKKGYSDQFTGIPNSGDTFSVGYLSSGTYFYVIQLREGDKTMTGYLELIF